jgi:outer membrane lipoprotein-sorting protein
MFVRSLSVLIAYLLLMTAAGQAQDLTLDQILKKNEDAIGGAEAISRVRTLKMVAKIFGRASLGVPITTWLKRPNLVRAETTVQDQNVISGFDGTTAWHINPLGGTSAAQKLGEQAAANAANSSIDITIGSLASFRAAGQIVELAGKENVNGSPAYVLKVTRKGAASTTYFLDAATFLPVKTLSKVDQTGPEIEIEAYPSDYKRVDGILFAYTIEQKVKGNSLGQIIYEQIEINGPMEESLFKMPGADQPEVKKHPSP